MSCYFPCKRTLESLNLTKFSSWASTFSWNHSKIKLIYLHFHDNYFFNRCYSLEFLAAPTVNSEALPITYSVCCVSRISWQTLQPITLCYCIFCTRQKSLFNIGRKWVHTRTGGRTTSHPDSCPRPLSYLNQAADQNCFDCEHIFEHSYMVSNTNQNILKMLRHKAELYVNRNCKLLGLLLLLMVCDSKANIAFIHMSNFLLTKQFVFCSQNSMYRK